VGGKEGKEGMEREERKEVMREVVEERQEDTD
jgi:hypothetical protein